VSKSCSLACDLCCGAPHASRARRQTPEPLDLTRTEYGVLSHYARNLNKTVPHEMVLAAVWGDGYESETHYVRLYVSRLRSKIETPDEPPYFETEHGLGYRLGA